MKRAKALATLVCVGQFLLYIPTLWRRPMIIGGSIFCVLPANLLWCEIVWEVINSFVPVIVIIVINITILSSLHQHAKDMRQALGPSKAPSASKDRGMTMMLILVATFMVILNLPWTFANFTWTYFIPDLREKEPDLAYFINSLVDVPGMANNAINFFLYCFASRFFRQDLKQLLTFRCLYNS
jgi:hypothetical protein